MVDILIQIISDLTLFSFVNAFEIVLGIITLVVLSGTLYFVIKYTKSTEALQITAGEQTKELIKQRRLTILPSLMFTWDSYGLKLRNVGNGTALNITLKKFKSFGKDQLCDILFSRIGVRILKVDEETLVTFTVQKIYINGIRKTLKLTQSSIKANFPSNNRNIAIDFTFQDIEGTMYEQKNFIINNSHRQGIVEKVEI